MVPVASNVHLQEYRVAILPGCVVYMMSANRYRQVLLKVAGWLYLPNHSTLTREFKSAEPCSILPDFSAAGISARLWNADFPDEFYLVRILMSHVIGSFDMSLENWLCL